MFVKFDFSKFFNNPTMIYYFQENLKPFIKAEIK